jgi:uncharacterized damage-inducible protein DinB
MVVAMFGWVRHRPVVLEPRRLQMTMTELFLAELERESAVTRRTLERVPDGRADWKPHERSMPLGYLSALVAQLPSWTAMIINDDELDLQPPGGQPRREQPLSTSRELVQTLDQGVAAAREALQHTTDEHLLTSWRLLVGGQVVSEQPRHIFLRDSVFNHLAHHRGQLTVYLRLNDAPVPSIYGPSADDRRFDAQTAS